MLLRGGNCKSVCYDIKRCKGIAEMRNLSIMFLATEIEKLIPSKLN
jgi:hypothetical protein